MYENFSKLLQENNVTRYRVSIDTGISQSTLSDWKRGRSEPKADKLKILAEYFDVSVDYLLGNTDIKKQPIEKTDKLSDLDIEINNKINLLNQAQKLEALNHLKYLLSQRDIH